MRRKTNNDNQSSLALDEPGDKKTDILDLVNQLNNNSSIPQQQDILVSKNKSFGEGHVNDDDDLSSSDEDISDEDEENESAPTLIRTPSIEKIVMGHHTTVEDDEHVRLLSSKNKNTMERISFHLLINDNDDDLFPSPMKRFKNITLDFVFKFIMWIRGSRIKRLAFLLYLCFMFVLLQIGEFNIPFSYYDNDSEDFSPSSIRRGGAYSAGFSSSSSSSKAVPHSLSSWGDTVTYYGEKQQHSAPGYISTTNVYNRNSGEQKRYTSASGGAIPVSVNIANIQNYQLSFLGLPPPATVKLPDAFLNIAEISSPLKKSDIPVFWQIPRSAGSSIKEMLGGCLQMVLASEAGAHLGTKSNDQYLQTLKVVTHKKQKYVTVDTSSKLGIQRAKYLNLAGSGMADAIISLFLHDISSIFTPSHNGRLFTILRHPVERSNSLFHYLSVANWEQTFRPAFAKMTIEDYARSPRVEFNWLTRFLSGDLRGELTQEHLNIAKEVLRRKCFIGLLEKKEESFQKIMKYFGWDQIVTPEQKTCIRKVVFDDWSNKNKHPQIEPDSDVWEILKLRNYFDMELYAYAKKIFEQQGQ